MDAGRIMRYTKSSALVNKRFRAFFVPALLAAMATQMGVFFDGIMVLRSVAGRIDYSLVLALNQTTITFMMHDKQNLEG